MSLARFPKHGIRANRHRDIEPVPDLHAEKSRRAYPYHGKQPAIQPDIAARYLRISGKLALPERVADHCGRRSATRLIVFLRECSANHGRHVQDVEEISADQQTLRVSRLAFLGEIELLCAPGHDSGKRLLMGSHAVPLRRGEVRAAR